MCNVKSICLVCYVTEKDHDVIWVIEYVFHLMSMWNEMNEMVPDDVYVVVYILLFGSVVESSDEKTKD